MRSGESTPAQLGIVDQRVLLHELADRPETSILQFAHIEMSARSLVFCPSQENVARCLHGTLTFDNSAAGMTCELGAQAFEHRFSCLFDLKEQRSAIVARKQPDGAERADASNTDCFEGDIPEKVSLEQTQYFWRKAFLVGDKNALGVNSMTWVAFLREMINHRQLIGDADLYPLYQMREVVVLFQSFPCFGQDSVELPSQLPILDMFDLARQVDPAMPDFQW